MTKIRTVRLRPYRRNKMTEAGITHPEGVSNEALAELWVAGQLEAVVQPELGAGMCLYHHGALPQERVVNVVRECMNALKELSA